MLSSALQRRSLKSGSRSGSRERCEPPVFRYARLRAISRSDWAGRPTTQCSGATNFDDAHGGGVRAGNILNTENAGANASLTSRQCRRPRIWLVGAYAAVGATRAVRWATTRSDPGFLGVSTVKDGPGR